MYKARYVHVNAAPTAREYLAGPEYADLRGLSLNAVWRKARFLGAEYRRLLLLLQALSLREGGFTGVAKDLLDLLPEVLGTKSMHSLKLPEDADYPATIADQLRCELRSNWHVKEACMDPALSEPLIPTARATRRELIRACRAGAEQVLPTLLYALCVNPSILVGDSAGYQDEMRRLYPELWNQDFRSPYLRFMRDVVPALLAYQRRFEDRAKADFVMTEVAGDVFRALDRALESPGSITVIEGRAGVGKSECVRAWCERHLGEARFVALPGIVSRTTFFAAICRALGLWVRSKTPGQMQAQIEEMLQQTKLMLCIDEAQAMMGSTERVQGPPELLNWVYSALANFNVPVALICTETFSAKVRQAARQVVWEPETTERRVSHYVKLPCKVSYQDLEAVARRTLPDAGATVIEMAVIYAGRSRFPMTRLKDILAEAVRVARNAGRAVPLIADMKSARQYRTGADQWAAESLSAEVEDKIRADRKAEQRHRSSNAAARQQPLGDEDLAGNEPVQNPRFDPANSGRPDRTLVPT